MLKLGELKEGDIVRIEDEGVSREGTVVEVSHGHKRVLINNGIQDFWFDLEHIHPIPVDDEQLRKLGFEKELNGESVKYMRGPFRIVVLDNDFSDIEMWYREDRRHFNTPIGVHHLQNLYHNMTKVHLERP